MRKQNKGQNFLINNSIALRELEYADIKKEDVILEIGPGKGILTKLLSQRAKKVIAIEIDKNLFEKLKNELPKNVVLLNKDALKVDFKNFPDINKIVSNLPYQISSPITFKFFDINFKKAILIYQEEFAERMVAQPGSKSYSRLSVAIYYESKCQILEKVSRSNFRPVPKVDSCIVEIIPRTGPPFHLRNKYFFYDLTRMLFNNRRKKIKNCLKKTMISNDVEIPFLDKRVEELSPEQIGLVSNVLYSKLKTL